MRGILSAKAAKNRSVTLSLQSLQAPPSGLAECCPSAGKGRQWRRLERRPDFRADLRSNDPDAATAATAGGELVAPLLSYCLTSAGADSGGLCHATATTWATAEVSESPPEHVPQSRDNKPTAVVVGTFFATSFCKRLVVGHWTISNRSRSRSKQR
eukprot:SAG31_NODE_954_length_10804_cov_3.240355_4_plen_156_part_00